MPPVSETCVQEGVTSARVDGPTHMAAALRRGRAWWRAFSNPTLLLCVAGVLLPNALSIGALIEGIGVPPRTAAIVGYAALAIAARIIGRAATVALYLPLVAYDVICTIAALFNLAPSEIGTVVDQLVDLEVFQSSLYVALTLGAVALIGANLLFLTLKGDAFRHGNAAVLAGLALAVAVADLAANTSPHYQFARFAAYGKPMESAAVKSGFQKAVLTGGSPRVLLVVVEALGQLADTEHRALLLGALQNPDLAGRYEITAGSVPFYGSTTAAEMRELCFSRETYEVLIDGKDLACLPRQMAARGYRTVSLHNFKGEFFDRDEWYPKLGFQTRLFGDEAASGPSHRLCGGPFRGPCDVDIIPTIARQLRDATGPTFLYWVTLSTHVPVALGEGTPRLGCNRDGGPIGHVKVCNMAEMWMDVLEGIGRLAADLPGMEILLVGDHAPPLWSRAGRALFRPGRVPWFRLKPVNAVQAAMTP